MKNISRASRRATTESKSIEKAFKENKFEKRKTVNYKRKSKHKLEY